MARNRCRTPWPKPLAGRSARGLWQEVLARACCGKRGPEPTGRKFKIQRGRGRLNLAVSDEFGSVRINVATQPGSVGPNLAVSGSIWQCQTQRGSVRLNLAMPDSTWQGQTKFGNVRLKWAMSCSIWQCQTQVGSVRLNLAVSDQYGSVRFSLAVC